MFNSRYQKFHVGNITRTRFRDLWESPRYWEVMQYLGSDEFNAQKACGPNCLQTSTNSWLDKFDKGLVELPPADAKAPAHLEFL